jgi:hypothetical protein
MDCPGFERLIDYLDGQVATDEDKRIKAHLAAGCRLCASDISWYEKVTAIAAEDETIEPPPWVTKRVVRLFEARAGKPGLREKVTQLIASLVFDSLAQPAIEGVRSTETINRQLLYRADDYSIDLQISLSDSPGAELVGQILRKDDLEFESVSRVPLDLMRKGETVCSTTTNETGEFQIPSVAFGEYDLKIDLDDVSITLAGLPVAQIN